jgi:hypothetical protein
MLLDDPTAEWKPQPGPLPHRLRREERLEDTSLDSRRNSGPAVPHIDHDPGSSRLGLRADGTLLMTWAFVLQEVEYGATCLIVRARAGPGYQFHGLPWWLGKRSSL